MESLLFAFVLALAFAAGAQAKDGVLVACGTFGRAYNESEGTGFIAAWSEERSVWTSLGGGMNFFVLALGYYKGELVAGGDFTSAGDTVAVRVARWSRAEWSGLGRHGTGDLVVNSFAVYNETLFAGGQFSDGGNLEVWDGEEWDVIPGGGVDGPVYSMLVHGDALVVGGSFEFAGGVAVSNIAQWKSGLGWAPLGDGLNSSVYATTLFRGDVVVCGAFGASGSVPMSFIGRWDGAAWVPLGAGLNYYTDAVTEFNGDLYAGGYFWEAGGIEAQRVARWDGTTWHAVGHLYGPGTIRAFAVLAGVLYAGGDFNDAPGIVARLDGTEWQEVGTGMSGTVYALAVL